MKRFVVLFTLVFSQAGCLGGLRNRADRMQWEMAKTNASLSEATVVLYNMNAELAKTNNNLDLAKSSLGTMEAELKKSNESLKILTKGLGAEKGEGEAVGPVPQKPPPALKIRP